MPINRIKLWREAAMEARKKMVKHHKKDFDGKMVLLRKHNHGSAPKCGATKLSKADARKWEMGHKWYLETYKIYCLKKEEHERKLKKKA